MKIEYIVFNFAIILFIIFLIYLYIYINYKYEKFTDNVSASTIEQNYLSNSTAFSEIDLSEIESNRFDGNSSTNAYPSNMIPRLKKNFEALRAAFPNNSLITSTTFHDGYYWVKFGAAGARYIYCIMNEAYYGGGWMLAMRGVKNSTTFKYDSAYWTNSATLNDSWETIKSVLQNSKILNINNDLSHEQIKNNDQLKFVSSLGEAIYRNDLTDINPSNNLSMFDIKTDAFNNYNAREWMAIFYYKNNSGVISQGGDLILESEGGRINGSGTSIISTANQNTRGWIWREAPPSSAANNAPQPVRQLFYDRLPNSANGLSNNNNKWDFLSRYGLNVNAQTLDKWSVKATDIGPRLWSGQEGFKFYGVNYEQPGTSWSPDQFKVRWGFVWNNETNEVSTSDSACGIGMNDYSCRDHYKWDGTQHKGINQSIAFEFYVR